MQHIQLKSCPDGINAANYPEISNAIADVGFPAVSGLLNVVLVKTIMVQMVSS